MPPLWICLLVIVILLALIVYVSTQRKGVCENVSQFTNQEPKSTFVKLVSEFDSPQIIINQKGGFAMWFPSKVYDNCPYESVILKDEAVSHGDNNIKNFLYTTIIIDIPPEKLKDILSISKNVYYDHTSKEFTVRSNSIVTNKRILFSVLKYLTDPSVTVKSAKELLDHTWVEKVVDKTPFASTTFSDQCDNDISNMINLNLPVGSTDTRVNRELMMLH